VDHDLPLRENENILTNRNSNANLHLTDRECLWLIPEAPALFNDFTQEVHRTVEKIQIRISPARTDSQRVHAYLPTYPLPWCGYS